MSRGLSFAPGSRVVVRDEEWIVRNVRATDTGGLAVYVTGLSELVRSKNAIFLTELDSPTELTPESTKLVYDPTPCYRRSRLYIESLLRRTPPTDNSLYVGHQAAMNRADYQLVPAHKALNQPRPRILIADAVGLGKTLEVGVLLSELIQRGRGERILVVALKSILSQFQEELWARFTIPLVRLDSVGIRRVQAKIPSNMNPFYYFDRVIISIDTLKKDDRYRRYLEECHWDAIVIDECQHVAVRGSHRQTSQRARLAQLLARNCDSLILTSATPHDGSAESFASLMNLLEPTAVADPSDYTKEEVKGLFVRRFKKDVASEVGDSFAERKLTPHRVKASPHEDTTFETLSQMSFKTIDSHRSRGGMLFRTTLLKAFLSSPAACASTVEKRLQRLEDRTDDDALHDRKELRQLLLDLNRIKDYQKLQKLFELLDEFGYKSSDPQRVVVFSERIDTLKFLEEEIQKRYKLKDHQIGVFYGTLDDQTQQAMVKDFGTENGKVRLLLGSDAASEGINLHYYCHRLIHFDIPWSLITLEQRNGRIDRFGQEHQPDIHYLLTHPSDPDIDGDLRILDRLIEKEDAAHKNLGDVAWLMNLHDALLEEERVAEAIQNREDPTEVIPDEPEEDDDFFAEFLASFSELETAPESVPTKPLDSLYTDDLSFAREAFKELELEIDWHDHLDGFSLVTPDDLKLRYEYLPPELNRRGDQLKLTTDRDLVQKALVDSRQDEGRWPEWELFWNLHPLAQWLNDRVLASFLRHEAPVLRIGGLRDPIYLFQGVISNNHSQPVLVSWFGVSGNEILEFQEFHHRIKDDLSNPGDDFDRESLKDGLTDAITAAREHLEKKRGDRGQSVIDQIREESRRIRAWERKKGAHFSQLDDGTKLTGPQRKRLLREREEFEKLVQARKDWFDQKMRTADRPYLRVVAVLI